jgi:hypothetical protein
MSNPIALRAGTFTGVANSAGVVLHGNYNFTLSGSWVGTVALERSYDDGVTWVVTSKPDLTPASFTANIDGVGLEPEAGVLYRWRCSAYTSGTIEYRLSR